MGRDTVPPLLLMEKGSWPAGSFRASFDAGLDRGDTPTPRGRTPAAWEPMGELAASKARWRTKEGPKESCVSSEEGQCCDSDTEHNPLLSRCPRNGPWPRRACTT